MLKINAHCIFMCTGTNVGTISVSVDLKIGQELLLMEEVQFAPHTFLCGPGTISQQNHCGRSNLPPTPAFVVLELYPSRTIVVSPIRPPHLPL
jgi:hypothetical protein